MCSPSSAPSTGSDSLGRLTPDGGGRTFVATVEIDRFADVRRRIGYTLANRLIATLAERLQLIVPTCQTGRVGRTSVEFAFTAGSSDDAVACLHQAITVLEQPFDLDGMTFDLCVTVGVADAGHGVVSDEQLDSAATALAWARERREKVHLAGSVERPPDDFDHVTIMRDLRGALDRGELALHYQPKLRSSTRTIDSAEGLLRWVHPALGPIRTDKLIDLAEATGAIRELTRWVIDRALTDRALLAAEGFPLTVFVNVSGVLLADRSFAAWALDRLRSAAGAIGFEITETAVIEDAEVAIDHLRQFSAAGIRIAIDDYGSGLSSLAYLKRLPADELKIDRMFVSGLTESHRDPLLVRSSIDLAHALEMEVTAEGVDDPLSLSLLRVMGCDMIQGFLVSPPLALADLTIFLREERHHACLVGASPALDVWAVSDRSAGKQR